MKEKIDQLYSEGINLLNDANYEEALKIFTSIKQLDESYAHIYYYYKGIINDIKGDDEGDLESKDNFYLAAEDSFFEAAKYQDMPPDTYFLLGNTIYKAGKLNHKADKLSKALSIFMNNPYPAEMAEEVKGICNQIEKQLNNNSPMSSRGSYLYNSNSQLIALNKSNNNEELTQSVLNRLSKLEHDFAEMKLTIADIQKILQSANVGYTANINDQIKELKVINPKLEEYYKCFNMALHNVCIAASAVSSGLVVPDAGHLERVSASSLIKWVCYLGDIAASGFLNPIATALIAVLHDAGDNMFNSKEEKKLVDVLTKFCKMINKQSDMTIPVAQDLQKLALLFAHLRSAEITKLDYADTKNSFSNFFETKLPMQSKFFRYDTTDTKEMNDKPIEKQAYKDAIALISYMYHNAEAILSSAKSFLNQILTTTKEGLYKSWDNVMKTTPGNVEYDLWQMEKQVPESEIITEKAKSGQLRSVKISRFSVDFSKPLLEKIAISSTGVRRGVEDFLDQKYFADKFTEDEQGCFILFLAYKIFRYGNKVCLEYFSEKQPELITKIFNDYPHLFFRREAINICIKNEEGRQKALDAIKLKSSDKFFKDCFDTVFPKVDFVVNLIFKEEPKPEHVSNEPELAFNLVVLPLEIDENGEVIVAGNVEDNNNHQ